MTKGGYFISTFPDYKVLLGKINKNPIKYDNFVVWENRYCSIIFNNADLYSQNPFGIKYGFFLDDDLVGEKRENQD